MKLAAFFTCALHTRPAFFATRLGFWSLTHVKRAVEEMSLQLLPLRCLANRTSVSFHLGIVLGGCLIQRALI